MSAVTAPGIAPVQVSGAPAPIAAPAAATPGTEAGPGFAVHLEIFEGPFDLLLSLISKRQLDVTEVALAQVTDEFLAFIRAAQTLDLEQLTGFLVIAATLVDLKAARLLPQGVAEDAEDLALLEARDLLFARLLQYRAYQQAAGWLADRFAAEARWTARTAGLPPELAALLPEVVLGVSPDQLAALAAQVLAPRVPDQVDVSHVHLPRASVHAHVAVLTERLVVRKTATFRALCADCVHIQDVVARFLAVLELLGAGSVAVDQVVALGDLQVRWVKGAAPSPAESDRARP